MSNLLHKPTSCYTQPPSFICFPDFFLNIFLFVFQIFSTIFLSFLALPAFTLITNRLFTLSHFSSLCFKSESHLSQSEFQKQEQKELKLVYSITNQRSLLLLLALFLSEPQVDQLLCNCKALTSLTNVSRPAHSIREMHLKIYRRNTAGEIEKKYSLRNREEIQFEK